MKMTKQECKGYKVIDLEIKGNTVRYYLAKDPEKLKEYWGDDWDDTPYEHNAGLVYPRYVDKVVDVFYPYDIVVTEPSDDWHYHSNSPFCKEDFKKRKAPRICIFYSKEPWGIESYSSVMGDENINRIYYGDPMDKIFTDAVYYMEVEVDDPY